MSAIEFPIWLWLGDFWLSDDSVAAALQMGNNA